MESGGAGSPTLPTRIGSGVDGLDEILEGGLPPRRFYLVKGDPGTGKTTLALQFLLAGLQRGERVLYVTLSETAEELGAIAASHGWSLEGLTIHEVAPNEASLRLEEQYTILHPSEVELGETTWAVLEQVERSRPTRLVFDSLSEIRLLARDPLRYRRQILGLKQFLAGRDCTVLLLDDSSSEDHGLESLAHGVVQLEQLTFDYGGERRRLRVVKLRGVAYRGGYHDFVLARGGLRVFPRLVAVEPEAPFTAGQVSSGVPELDRLLGGLDRGTSVLLIGPAGVGKSVLASQYVTAAAQRGERAALYIFDEGTQTYLKRADGLEVPLRPFVASGQVLLRQLDPNALSPGEFDYLVRQAVETDGCRLVVLDSLNGYLNAMSELRFVLVQLHELLRYLNQQGILTLMTMAQHGLLGDQLDAPIDVSYLADSVVLLRYFEALGQLRQAISVVKKRSGAHERTIRELRLGPGVRVGPPLAEFQGVLTGRPTFVGAERALLSDGHAERS
jgi:circadian clock protein KaiC